jgi:hypothetical protein
VDGWDRRLVLLQCEAVPALAIATVAVTMLNYWLTLTHLFVVAVVNGAASALFEPAREVGIRSVVARRATRHRLRPGARAHPRCHPGGTPAGRVAACGDKEVATTPETSTPAQTTTASQQPSPTPSDTPSVASVGDTINLTGQEEGG